MSFSPVAPSSPGPSVLTITIASRSAAPSPVHVHQQTAISIKPAASSESVHRPVAPAAVPPPVSPLVVSPLSPSLAPSLSPAPSPRPLVIAPEIQQETEEAGGELIPCALCKKHTSNRRVCCYSSCPFKGAALCDYDLVVIKGDKVLCAQCYAEGAEDKMNGCACTIQ